MSSFSNNSIRETCAFKVKITGYEIKHTTCTKYLGVYIKQNLSWTNHIHDLELKLSRSVGMFHRTRYYLSNK